MSVGSSSLTSAFTEAWAAEDRTPRGGTAVAFQGLYPMPGDRAFEDDGRFRSLPLFISYKGEVVRAGDLRWVLPKAWLAAPETKVASACELSFDLLLRDGNRLRDHPGGMELELSWKRAAYLCIFRSGQPLKPRTMQSRIQAIGHIVRAAVETGKPLKRLTRVDLAGVSRAMGKHLRPNLKPLYAILGWWRDERRGTYPFFDPPSQSPRPRRGDGHVDPAASFGDETPRTSGTWQPFPDAFVEDLGALAVAMVDRVRPVATGCCRQLRAVTSDLGRPVSKEEASAVIRACSWPPEARTPSTPRDLLRVCADCQTAAEMLASLLLGPRAGELLALPGGCIRLLDGADGAGLLDGTTFKYALRRHGDDRDWPMHRVLVGWLEGQREYVAVTEGPDFQWLWKSHISLFGTGRPSRGVWKPFNTFVRRHGLLARADRETIHHHRFRKTAVRQIVLSLQGSPSVIRRLLGHEDIGVTMAYVMSDETIVDDLRETAEAERMASAAAFVERKDEILGRGGEILRKAVDVAVETIKLVVPRGKRSQKEVSTADIVTYLAGGPDGLTMQQVVPGLIACFRPDGEAGSCCGRDEPPNVTACDPRCPWNAMLPEYETQARLNVADAVSHIRGDPGNVLLVGYYRDVARRWCDRFPSLHAEFRHEPLLGWEPV